MFVADSEESFRRVIREETIAAYRSIGGMAEPAHATYDPELILTYLEAGKLIGRSKETIRLYVSKGWLKKYGSGRTVGVKRTELVAFMASGRPQVGQNLESRADEIVGKSRRGKK
jgi:hypothetical protein